jgi:2-keto-4-pentenoate hydratase/2-oxohepta-3-ene-1,7-dioic acid hydratase in catechol pathway
MKLGSLKEGGRDGTLVVVSRDLTKAVRATGIAPTLQRALEDWSNTAPRLNALAESLDAGDADGVFDLDMQALAAPLPRAYEFVDGSAYLPHVARVRKARGAEVPESFYVDPLMYQGVSAGFYGPRDAVKVVSEDYGIDLEAEIVIVTDDVPMAVTPEQAASHIQLIGLVNDVSLRNLIPNELAKGFGFLQSKPRSALSPVFVTPDELGDAWRDNKLHLPLVTHINGSGSARRKPAWTCSSTSPNWWRMRRRRGRCRPARSSAPARWRTRTPRWAPPASPSSARWKPCATASRPRRSWRSATWSGSRCWTPPATACSARSNSGSSARTSPEPPAGRAVAAGA